MNNINEKGENACSSCGVCVISCPVKCISFSLDDDGFYRPSVDENNCIECGDCKLVCFKYIKRKEPYTNFFEDKLIYGAWSKDADVLNTTSSGGVAHEILSTLLKNNYIACGVTFKPEVDICKHEFSYSIEDLEKFKSSKYLQSYTLDAFSKFDKTKKFVVIGTPCQIYGLRKYIQKENIENNFILVDIFCHGTPTILLWKKYKKYLEDNFKLGEIRKINFRDKKMGWHKYGINLIGAGKQYFSEFNLDIFGKFFISDSILNESCYECPLRHDFCHSDIRVADFWGDKYKNNEKGVSLVVVNTESGKKVWEEVKHKLCYEKCTFDDLINSQPNRFYKPHPKSKLVMEMLKSEENLEEIFKKTIKRKLHQKIYNRLKLYFKI